MRGKSLSLTPVPPIVTVAPAKPHPVMVKVPLVPGSMVGGVTAVTNGAASEFTGSGAEPISQAVSISTSA